jgi:hydrogenase nickel incorporation protein HypA/HybF
MHELGITTEIVDIAMRYSTSSKVRRVIVEIGRETAVLPDAVRFCFDLCAEGTCVEGAELEIVEMSGAELRVRAVEVL